MRPWLRYLYVAVVLLGAAASVVRWSMVPPGTERTSWEEFLDHLKKGDVASVVVDGRHYRGRYKPGCAHERVETEGPEIDADPALRELIVRHAELEIEEPPRWQFWRR